MQRSKKYVCTVRERGTGIEGGWTRCGQGSRKTEKGKARKALSPWEARGGDVARVRARKLPQNKSRISRRWLFSTWPPYPLRFPVSSASQISWAHLDCPLFSFTPSPFSSPLHLLSSPPLGLSFSALHLVLSSLPAPTHHLPLHAQPGMLGSEQMGEWRPGMECEGLSRQLLQEREGRKTLPVPSLPLTPPPLPLPLPHGAAVIPQSQG